VSPTTAGKLATAYAAESSTGKGETAPERREARKYEKAIGR